MKILLAAVCALCASVVSAATFKAPVHAVKRDPLGLRQRRDKLREEEIVRARRNSHRVQMEKRDARQQLLRHGLFADAQKNDQNVNELSNFEAQEDYTSDALSLWDCNEITYLTNITLGTPPQSFRMLVSISDSTLFVPSVHCPMSCSGHLQYNSSFSSTHSPHSERFFGGYFRAPHTSNLLSQDTLSLGGLTIKDQFFGELEEIFCVGPEWMDDDTWDGYLGLAPVVKQEPHFSSSLLLNPFLEMKKQKLLDRNVFGLKLPRGDGDPGEIMFGAINEVLYEGELVHLPLVNDTDDAVRIQGRWKVNATSISIGDGFASLDGYVALLETDFPGIGLREDFVTLLENYLGMERKGERDQFPSIDCAKRDKLEDFTITLGSNDFVVSPYEYTLEVELDNWGGKKRCISAFFGVPDFGDHPKFIALGSAFMRGFYGVFDLDEWSVGLAKVASSKGKGSVETTEL